MANEYATLEQFKTRLANKTAPSEDTELMEIVEAASRGVDDYLRVPAAYFIPPTVASTRKLKGLGNSFIALPMPLYGEVTILAPSGFTVPNFDVLADELRLITLDGTDIPTTAIVWEKVYYSITGSWGYAVIPPQVREATLQLSVHFFRGRDKALSGTITDMRQDEQFPERDYPRQTRRLLDGFLATLGGKPAGGLYFA